MAEATHHTPTTSELNALCAQNRKLTPKNHGFGLLGNYAKGVITTIKGVDTADENIPFRDVCHQPSLRQPLARPITRE